MVSLSDAGWSAPRIARHLSYHPQTVRDALRAFLARGTAALRPFRSGPAPDTERSDRVTSALRGLLAQKRTWTSGQLSRALAEQGIDLGARQVRRYLKRIGARYRRTGQTLRHKQDPAKAERAGRVLANLKAKAAAGLLKLYYLDECGFAPTLPTASSWPPRRAEAGRVRGASAATGQRPGRLPAVRSGPAVGCVHGRAGLEGVRPAGLPRGLAVVESPARGRARRRVAAHRQSRACGEVGPGSAGDLPLLPSAVQPGVRRDRAGVPADHAPGDAAAELHHPPRAARGGGGGIHRLWSAAATKTSRKTTSGCLAT